MRQIYFFFIWLYIFFHLFIYPTIYPFIQPSICPSIRSSVFPFIYSSILSPDLLYTLPFDHWPSWLPKTIVINNFKYFFILLLLHLFLFLRKEKNENYSTPSFPLYPLFPAEVEFSVKTDVRRNGFSKQPAEDVSTQVKRRKEITLKIFYVSFSFLCSRCRLLFSLLLLKDWRIEKKWRTEKKLSDSFFNNLQINL